MTTDMYKTGEYLKKNPSYHVEDSPWKAKQILQMLHKHGLKPQSVCEIGCGAGEILNQLSSHFPEASFFGYDISSQAILLAKKRENDRLHFFCEDLLEMNSHPYELLLSIDVFEHVEDYMSFLKRLRSKGKWFIFHIPLDITVHGILRGLLIQFRTKLGHLHYFTKETALATLADTGFEIVDWCYTPGGLDLAKSFKGRLGIWPRRLLAVINRDLAVRLLGGFSLLVLAKPGESG